MWFNLINIVFHLMCRSHQTILNDSFTIVTDRSILIREINIDKTKMQLEIQKNEDILDTKFIWDKYFPKLLFYNVEYSQLTKTDINFPLNFVCLSSKKEVLWKFKIDYYNDKLVISEIYEDDKKGTIKHGEPPFNFILGINENNVESINNSCYYIKYIESLKPLYLEIFQILYNYFDELQNLLELVEVNIKNRSIDLLTLKTNKIMIDMINIIMKGLASLYLPSLSKLEHQKDLKYYSDKFNELFELVEDISQAVEEDLQDQSKSGEITEVKKKTTISYLTECVIRIVESTKQIQFKKNYWDIFDKLKFLDVIVKNIVDKGNINLQIVLDCDLVATDSFVGKYSAILIKYCEILEDFDEGHLTSFYLNSSSSEMLVETKLKEIYITKLILTKLKYWISNYEQEKTDFLIFSQTDYFRKDLARIILNSLLDLIVIEKINSSVNDDEKIGRIKDLLQLWKSIIDPKNSGELISFENLLNEKKNDKENVYINKPSVVKYETKIYKTEKNYGYLFLFLGLGILLIIGLIIAIKLSKV